MVPHQRYSFSRPIGIPTSAALIGLALGLGDASVAAQDPAARTVVIVQGRVQSQGRPVPGAVISLTDSRVSTASDSGGRFSLAATVRAGRALMVRAIGFLPRTVTLPVEGASPGNLIVELLPAPQPLPELVVERPGPAPVARLAGFEERRRRGLGVFLTGDDLDHSGALTTGDLLRHIPGVHLSFGGDGTRVHFTRCTERVSVWVDGIRIREPDHNEALRVVHPRDVAAMEVLSGRGPATGGVPG